MERVKKLMRRQALSTIGITMLAGAYGLDFSDELMRQSTGYTPVWKYDTEGFSRAVTLILNPWVKLVAGGIISHGPDWSPTPWRADYHDYARPIQPNKPYTYSRLGASQRQPNIFELIFAHTSFGIQEVGILGLDLQGLASLTAPKAYHYAYEREGYPGLLVTSKAIPATERVKILLDNSLTVLALSPNTLDPLPTTFEGPYDRFDPKFKYLRQF